jgi:hypothetical protein
MSGKKIKVVQIEWPTGAKEACALSTFLLSAADYFDGSEPGDEWHLTIVEMEQAAYDALPEFMGP